MTRLVIESVAAGGDGIGKFSGKVVFVPGAVPGDMVDVELTMDKPRFARARLLEVVEPSSDRAPMPCRHAPVCGGCTWQMVGRHVQLQWKQRAVVDALERIGRLDAPPVRAIVAPGPDFGYRNRLDLHPSPDGPGLYRSGSRHVVVLAECLLAAPPVAALLDEVMGRPAPSALTLRAGLRTGEAAIIDGSRAGAVITEIVDGVRFQVTGRAFFQPNTDGAETLVGLAREAAEGASGRLVDAYAGVGLFAATVGDGFDEVVAIESDRTAGHDLRANVPGARVLDMTTEAGLGSLDASVDLLLVDPPRTGLGREAVVRIVELAPLVIVSVSCDAATFARDARLLVDAGYKMHWVQPVDQFPQTPHIETVARFTRF